MSDTQSPEKIYVAGHRGMDGSAIIRALQKQGETNIVARTHAELDLTNQAAVQHFFAQEKLTQVCLGIPILGNSGLVYVSSLSHCSNFDPLQSNPHIKFNYGNY